MHTMTAHSMMAYACNPPVHLERKIKKPLMEKRRRARINQCLGELKSLLLNVTPVGGSVSHPTKLEKADILEMTVQYLRTLNAMKAEHDTTLARQNFLDGYSHCVKAIQLFLATTGFPDPSFQQRLVQFLSRQLTTHMEQQISSATTAKHRPQQLSLQQAAPAAPSRELSISIPQPPPSGTGRLVAPVAVMAAPPTQSQQELPTPPFRRATPAAAAQQPLLAASLAYPHAQMGSNVRSSSTSSYSSFSTTGSSLSPLSSTGSVSPRTPFTPGKAAPLWRPW